MATWYLFRDSTGDVLAEGTEQEVKAAYRKAETIEVAGDLYIEAPNGAQLAWNPNIIPAGWDEI
jgi:hypothetical protein